MGDASYDIQQLSRESFRLDTYDANTLGDLKIQLARAGFYYTRNGFKVKCFVCHYELDASEINQSVDVVSLHKEKRPECRFAKRLEPGMNHARSKKFLSYDSLRYEKERLETFIEWPIPWLSPDDLASDGFYYLRTNDHCACVFCRGIVGAWEVGDTPRGEHQRHFPHCPFIRGQPVGNVPLNHSTILDKLPLDGEECPLPPPRCEYTIDEAGNGAGASGGRHMPGSYAECKGPTKRNNVNYDAIGLPKYTGPKRKDYITKESRVKSFDRWPERVVQKPDEMAEAGFFYCGLSDHVRCFHCGNGLRNWEIDDKPWDEHARWYPDCNYVVLSRGQEFIDKVRRERPPYLRSAASKDKKPQRVSASSGQFKPINENDLEPLMESDIIQAVKIMGFPLANIRRALRQKLEQTGMPFFSLEPCIEAVLQIMEEETRRTIQESNDDVEDEAMASQSDKMQALNSESRNAASSGASGSSGSVSVAGPSRSGAASTSNATTTQSVAPAATQQSAAATLTTTSTSTVSSSTMSSASVTASASAGSNVMAAAAASIVTTTPAQSNTQVEAMEVEESEVMETEAQEGPAATGGSTAQPVNFPGSVITIQEADERMTVASELLKPMRSPQSPEAKGEDGKSAGDSLEEQTSNDVKKASVASAQSSQKDIAEELERIRESRTCKICMDAEMDVVFLPCTHMATCSSCAVTMAQCPICRNDIKYTIKPIFS